MTNLTTIEKALQGLNELSKKIDDNTPLLMAIIVLADIVRVIKEEVTLELLVRTKKGGHES